MSTTLRTDDIAVTADRRAVLFGFGAIAASASFGSFVTAAPAAAAPMLAAPVPAVFWNLGYTDVSGAVAACAPRARAVASRELDPHAQLLGR